MSTITLLDDLRGARESYERSPVGRDESSKFWKGLVNRWNNALATARKLAAEGATKPPVGSDPIEGEVLDPSDPGPIGTAPGNLLDQLFLDLLERRMTTTPGQGGLNLAKLFMDFRAFIRNPIVQKLLNGGAATLAELETLPHELLGTLTGQATSQAALPAPATTTESEPAKVEPAPVKVEPALVEPPKATPPVSPLWANLGTAGTLLSGIAGLWAGGAMPDTTALVSSAAATALSFTGIPAPVINGVLSLFKGLKITRTTA